MASVLVLYWSVRGHTARVARRLCDAIVEAGGRAEMMDVKEAIAAQMFRLLQPGGTLFIADYGEQRGLMRLAFRTTVQALDGVKDTEPHAKGQFPAIIREAGLKTLTSRSLEGKSIVARRPRI